MKLVTGGAGFIGSHLVDALVERGEAVRVLDNLSTGRRAFLDGHLKRKRVQLQRGDVFRTPDLVRALRDVDEVHHLAADPDVRMGIKKPWNNFRDGAIATFRVLDAMRHQDVSRIVFSSSSVVYGEATRRPTPEDYGPLLPVSPYGASKLAGEALVTAFVGTYGFQAWIYRFGNVVGPRLTHGVLHDFAHQLRTDPTRLKILGDGTQDKSYLSTADCIEGMLHGLTRARENVNLFNLASPSTTPVRRLAEILVEELHLPRVRFEFTGGPRGWAGDVAKMHLDIAKIGALGWRPRHASDDAVRLTARWLAQPDDAGRRPARVGPARIK